jgi:hypothetical protein
VKITTWKILETEIEDHLKAYQRLHPIFYHRFPDSRAAGNLIADQPSDFLVADKRGMILLEAKFSEVHDSLRSSFSGAVSPGQIASARLAHRAGQRYLFLFYSSSSGFFELWPGDYCSDRRSLGRPLEAVKRLAVRRSLTEILEEDVLALPKRNFQDTRPARKSR